MHERKASPGQRLTANTVVLAFERGRHTITDVMLAIFMPTQADAIRGRP